ncbi:LOW QUALITY PROTEIN: cytochrome P450 27C1 [Dugong dugon]
MFDTSMYTGQIHVDSKLRDVQCQVDGQRVKGGSFTDLFLSQELTPEEIYDMTEMLLASVHTDLFHETSFTLSWSVYPLARHAEVQQTMYWEVAKNLGEKCVPSAAEPQVTLVRALLMETLRLFSVLPGNGQATQEDLVVGGYLIPKGTQPALCHYATAYEDEGFSRAKKFWSELSLWKGIMDRADNFGSMAFGYRVLSCIAWKIAELEIHLMILVGNMGADFGLWDWTSFTGLHCIKTFRLKKKT